MVIVLQRKSLIASTILLGALPNASQTRKTVFSIDIHRARPTNPLSTRSAKRESGIDCILYVKQGVEYHAPASTQFSDPSDNPLLGYIDCIALHMRLDISCRIKAIDLKETIVGRSGEETILGRSGEETIVGHSGEETILGCSGEETILGRSGEETDDRRP